MRNSANALVLGSMSFLICSFSCLSDRFAPIPLPPFTSLFWNRWDDDAGFQSDLTCVDYTLNWEARIRGVVTLSEEAGLLGVHDVKVTAVAENDLYQASVITDEDGEFEFRLLLPHPPATELVALTLTFEKTTVSKDNTIVHQFTHNNIPTTNVTFHALKHLSFDNMVHVVDTTSMLLKGHVYVAGTGGDNRWSMAHDPSLGPSLYPYGCPRFNASVCVLDLYTAATIRCTRTDLEGRYTLAAPLGTEVFFRVEDDDGDTFELLADVSTRKPLGSRQITSPSGETESVKYYQLSPEGQDPSLSVDFVETTRANVTLEVLGGFCNRTLGDVMVEMQMPSCGSRGWSHQFRQSGKRLTLLLPAQKLSFRLVKLLYGEVEQAVVAQVLKAAQQDVITVDASESSGYGSWVYHGQPSIDTKYSVPSSPCPRLDMFTKKIVTVDITVVETFPWVSATCDNVQGEEK